MNIYHYQLSNHQLSQSYFICTYTNSALTSGLFWSKYQTFYHFIHKSTCISKRKWLKKIITIPLFHIKTLTMIFKRFYLFIFRERRREGEREWKKHLYVRGASIGCPLHASHCAPGPPPRHVPWWGIRLETVQFAGQHSVHWATPVKAMMIF